MKRLKVLMIGIARRLIFFFNQGNSGGIIDTAEFIMTTLALKRLASDSRRRNSVTVP